MNINFAPLLVAMEEMCRVYRDMNSLSAEKQQVIMRGDTTRLEEIVRQELRLVHESAGLDKKREQAAAQLALEAGIGKDEQINITRLAALGGDGGDRLAALGKELASLLSGQKKLNEASRNLLEAHIEYADVMLNLMVGPEDPLNNIYGAQGTGEKERRQSPGLFDRQA